MNAENRNIEFEDVNQPPAQQEQQKPKRRLRAKDLIDGTFLVRDDMIKQIPYVLFLTFLGIIYIGNRFYSERMTRKINALKTEVTNLRTEQVATASELMNLSRPSEIQRLLISRNLDLKESLQPPEKLSRK